MKAENIIYSFVILLLLIVGCEEEDEIDDGIKKIEIVTDKNVYNTLEKINVSISNNLSDTASYFKCENHELRLSHIVKKEYDAWIEEDYPLLCTQTGPMGYWGVIVPSQIKNDSLKIDSSGEYKLKYTFIMNGDTLYYESNEFEVIGNNSDVKSIDIETNKSEYSLNEFINISITNNLPDTAYHFKCDNHDLRLSHIVKKEHDAWIEEVYPILCNTLGQMGYWGVIVPSQIKNDSLKIDSSGEYKLKYTFRRINGDTLYYESNEFEIID